MGYNTITGNSISSNNIKLTADKIILGLDQVREEGLKSKRRWIWELMQNAKDVPNIYSKVSVEITINSNELIFAHNGNSFNIDNLTGLVQQVSSKHSGNKDKKVTGKFGTGFITTHLLSEIIRIEGVLQEDNEIAKSFSLELDRSGQTSEELMPSIKDALKTLNNIDESENFKDFPDYETQRKENIYNNKFIYSLTPEALKTAIIGVEDLMESLPNTLVFLKDEIKQVSIINNIDNTNICYNVATLTSEDEYKEISVSTLNNTTTSNKCFILKHIKEDDVQLLAEVENFSNYKLIPVANKQPFLYRDFPLVGTEKFYFPFIFNGTSLNPTEKRDSILLNGNSIKVTHNRSVVEKAILQALNFVDYLITKGAKNLYSTCLSSLPEYNYDEENNTKDWYIEKIQKVYRESLINKKLVINETETYSLKEIRFPTSEEYNTPELRDLITEYLGKGKVPVNKEQEFWTKHLGPEQEMATWTLNLNYGINELVKDIDTEIDLIKNKNIPDVINWLNSLYSIIEEIDYKLHTQYKLVPNHNNKLCRLPSLYIEEISEDDKSKLPIPFLNLLNELGENWFDILIHRDITISKKDHQKKSMSDLNSAINTIFRKEGFLNDKDSINHLLKVHAIVAPNSKEESLQRQLLEISSVLFNKEISLISESYSSKYNYEIVYRLIIQSINIKIEQTQNIEGLSTALEKTEEDTVIWLDNYLRLLESKTDYEKFLKEGKIIPNRTKIKSFCNYEQLKNYGTKSQPLNDELIKILEKLNTKNYFEVLIADGIGIRVSETLDFEKLGLEVVNEAEKIERDKTFEDNRDALLELINWTEDESQLTRTYLNKLTVLSGRLFYILTIENSDNRENVMKILKSSDKINDLASIIDSGTDISVLKKLADLFPNGIPEKIISFATEEARNKKEFNNLLEVGSKVEKLFIDTLSQYNISSKREKIIHAGGGAYDIRIHNPDTGKSFLIELKSCRFENTDPINIAVSQAKRAVKELENENFAFVIVERTVNNIMDENYIKTNTKYFKNPGEHLTSIGNRFDLIKENSNTTNKIDLKMDHAEFKGLLDYEWVKEKVGTLGFEDLLIDIKKVLDS